MATLLSLNQDVLLELISHLPSGDAFHLALTCHYAYTLAFPRVLAHCAIVAKEKTKRRVRRFRDFILRANPRLPQGSPIRYVRSLDLRRIRPDKHGVELLNTVLCSASRLRALSLSHAYINLENPNFGPPVLGNIFHWITTLVLEGCNQHTLINLTKFPGESLETMSLHFTNEYVDRSTLQPFDPHAFLRNLAHFPRLRDLKLLNANFFTIGTVPPSFYRTLIPSPVLPSIRRLDLQTTDLILETLLAACRGLNHLSFCLTHYTHISAPLSGAAPPWPSPLRSITWNSVANEGLLKDVAPSAIARLPRVHRFTLSNALHVPADSLKIHPFSSCGNTEQAFTILAQTQPVVVDLTVYVSPDITRAEWRPTPPFWSSFALSTPRLRSLELTLDISGWPTNYIHCLCDALIALPKLLHLGLDIPPLTSPHPMHCPDGADESVRETFYKDLRWERGIELMRVEHFQAIIAVGAGLMRSLNVLRVGHMLPGFHPEAGDEEMFDKMMEIVQRGKRSLSVTTDIRQDVQWYGVGHGVDEEGEVLPRRFVEISRDEGERLRELAQADVIDKT
ncbi:uncharacterized protein BXZ73DRAFT_105729 [Epithele typhae]|uniref:uncharacterized protein n=1 Tax=Epithele typhae TaxID=378194 RepID=UPI0020089CDB|nr:uncharacterized protein BXZ73DRAFT_105729 [Epithele typhae]KAH9916751.1 hypothetical protein BXZ73DRAFT_105729 [Epithele typhae]